MIHKIRSKYKLTVGIISLAVLPTLLFYRLSNMIGEHAKYSFVLGNIPQAWYDDGIKKFGDNNHFTQEFHFSSSEDSIEDTIQKLHQFALTLNITPSNVRGHLYIPITFSSQCKFITPIRVLSMFAQLNTDPADSTYFTYFFVGRKLLVYRALRDYYYYNELYPESELKQGSSQNKYLSFFDSPNFLRSNLIILGFAWIILSCFSIYHARKTTSANKAKNDAGNVRGINSLNASAHEK